MAVRRHHRTLLVKHFLLDTSINCFLRFLKHCWVNSFVTWLNGQAILAKQISNYNLHSLHPPFKSTYQQSKAWAKRSNIVGPTFEICLSRKMFDRLVMSKTLLVQHVLFAVSKNVLGFTYQWRKLWNQRHTVLDIFVSNLYCNTMLIRCWEHFSASLSYPGVVLSKRKEIDDKNIETGSKKDRYENLKVEFLLFSKSACVVSY